MEPIGEDLLQEETEFESPEWHATELALTEQRVREGKEMLIDWDEAKKKLWMISKKNIRL